MFDFHCVECERRLLLFPSRIEEIINDDQGIVMIVRCWCGQLGAVRTGAAAHARDRRPFELAS